MMKKLLLLSTVLLTITFAGKAQTTYTAMVTDTLHYYFNKYYFKTGQTTYSNYPYYKSAAGTVTNVTHCGSRFENAANNLTITGLEAFAAKSVVSARPKINVHLYLCNLNSNGLPQMPPIDSVKTEVNATHQGKPGIIGGNFINNPSYVMTGDFAVLLRNMSDLSGDTVYLLRTAGKTFTNVAAGNNEKYSDGKFGFVRYLGQFFTTQNFTTAAGFGNGTDYEFMVAPRVQYEVQASQQLPQNLIDFNDGTIDTLCARTVFNFTNTSSYQFTNRFYNLNEFYRKWNLVSPFVAAPITGGGFSTDTAITWNFEYEELAVPVRDPRTFLPYVNTGINQGNISSATGMAGCFDNQFRAKLRPMSAFGRQPQVGFVIPFRICLKYCNGDGEGISSNGFLPNLAFYPNPLVNGVARFTGLEGKNRITAYDILGQEIFAFENDKESVEINFQNQPAGTYFVRVSNQLGQSQVIKVVNAD